MRLILYTQISRDYNRTRVGIIIQVFVPLPTTLFLLMLNISPKINELIIGMSLCFFFTSFKAKRLKHRNFLIYSLLKKAFRFFIFGVAGIFCPMEAIENHRIFLGYSLVYYLPFLYNIFHSFLYFICFLFMYRSR